MGRFYGVVVFVWILLFFGGAMLPAVTGISLECHRKEDRPGASSLMQLLANVFGYVLGIVLPSLLSKGAGMRLAFLWSWFGLVGMLGGLAVARKDAGSARNAGWNSGSNTELTAP